MAGALFVARENYFNILLLMQDIEDFQDDATGEPKESLHPFALETFQKDFGSRELHGQLLFAVRLVLLLLFSAAPLVRQNDGRRVQRRSGQIPLKISKVRTGSLPWKNYARQMGNQIPEGGRLLLPNGGGLDK
jgi:hypothetical protein